jgi:predicted aminopeptidase
VPAFARMFEAAGRDWPTFHANVAHLAALPAASREHDLNSLLRPTASVARDP